MFHSLPRRDVSRFVAFHPGIAQIGLMQPVQWPLPHVKTNGQLTARLYDMGSCWLLVLFVKVCLFTFHELVSLFIPKGFKGQPSIPRTSFEPWNLSAVPGPPLFVLSVRRSIPKPWLKAGTVTLVSVECSLEGEGSLF